MKTVAARMDLGMTRIAGYILFDQQSLEFHETTPREVERLVKQGQVNGLKFASDGTLVPDLESWNLGDMMIKSSVGNYRHWNPDGPRNNTIYSVVRQITFDNIGTIYEVINNRCGRVFYTGKQLSVLSTLACVGGIRVNQENDTIELCKGVQVEDWSTHEAFELGNQVMTKDKLKETLESEQGEQDAGHEQSTEEIEQTMAELFNQAGYKVEDAAALEGTEAQGQADHESTPDSEGTSGLEGTEDQEGQAVTEAPEDQEQQEGQENPDSTSMEDREGKEVNQEEDQPFEPSNTWETPDMSFIENQEHQGEPEAEGEQQPEGQEHEGQEPQEQTEGQEQHEGQDGTEDKQGEDQQDEPESKPAAPKKSASRSHKKKH